VVAAAVSLVAAGGAADQSHRLAMWTAQNLLGSGTHVILSFLLMAVHRDVLTADPKQPRALMAGTSAALVGTGAGFFFLYYADRTAYAYTAAILFGVFGMHHMLAQHKGFWSLHGLRGSQAGLPWRTSPGPSMVAPCAVTPCVARSIPTARVRASKFPTPFCRVITTPLGLNTRAI
jgi:hypothetical protein